MSEETCVLHRLQQVNREIAITQPFQNTLSGISGHKHLWNVDFANSIIEKYTPEEFYGSLIRHLTWLDLADGRTIEDEKQVSVWNIWKIFLQWKKEIHSWQQKLINISMAADTAEEQSVSRQTTGDRETQYTLSAKPNVSDPGNGEYQMDAPAVLHSTQTSAFYMGNTTLLQLSHLATAKQNISLVRENFRVLKQTRLLTMLIRSPFQSIGMPVGSTPDYMQHSYAYATAPDLYYKENPDFYPENHMLQKEDNRNMDTGYNILHTEKNAINDVQYGGLGYVESPVEHSRYITLQSVGDRILSVVRNIFGNTVNSGVRILNTNFPKTVFRNIEDTAYYNRNATLQQKIGNQVIDTQYNTILQKTGDPVFDMQYDRVLQRTGDSVFDMRYSNVLQEAGDSIFNLYSNTILQKTGDPVFHERYHSQLQKTVESDLDTVYNNVLQQTDDSIETQYNISESTNSTVVAPWNVTLHNIRNRMISMTGNTFRNMVNPVFRMWDAVVHHAGHYTYYNRNTTTHNGENASIDIQYNILQNTQNTMDHVWNTLIQNSVNAMLFAGDTFVQNTDHPKRYVQNTRMQNAENPMAFTWNIIQQNIRNLVFSIRNNALPNTSDGFYEENQALHGSGGTPVFNIWKPLIQHVKNSISFTRDIAIRNFGKSFSSEGDTVLQHIINKMFPMGDSVIENLEKSFFSAGNTSMRNARNIVLPVGNTMPRNETTVTFPTENTVIHNVGKHVFPTNNIAIQNVTNPFFATGNTAVHHLSSSFFSTGNTVAQHAWNPIFGIGNTVVQHAGNPIFSTGNTVVRHTRNPIFGTENTAVQHARNPVFGTGNTGVQHTGYHIFDAGNTAVQHARNPVFGTGNTAVYHTRNSIFDIENRAVQNVSNTTYATENAAVQNVSNTIYATENAAVQNVSNMIFDTGSTAIQNARNTISSIGDQVIQNVRNAMVSTGKHALQNILNLSAYAGNIREHTENLFAGGQYHLHNVPSDTLGKSDPSLRYELRGELRYTSHRQPDGNEGGMGFATSAAGNIRPPSMASAGDPFAEYNQYNEMVQERRKLLKEQSYTTSLADTGEWSRVFRRDGQDTRSVQEETVAAIQEIQRELVQKEEMVIRDRRQITSLIEKIEEQEKQLGELISRQEQMEEESSRRSRDEKQNTDFDSFLTEWRLEKMRYGIE